MNDMFCSACTNNSALSSRASAFGQVVLGSGFVRGRSKNQYDRFFSEFFLSFSFSFSFLFFSFFRPGMCVVSRERRFFSFFYILLQHRANSRVRRDIFCNVW